MRYMGYASDSQGAIDAPSGSSADLCYAGAPFCIYLAHTSSVVVSRLSTSPASHEHKASFAFARSKGCRHSWPWKTRRSLPYADHVPVAEQKKADTRTQIEGCSMLNLAVILFHIFFQCLATVDISVWESHRPVVLVHDLSTHPANNASATVEEQNYRLLCKCSKFSEVLTTASYAISTAGLPGYTSHSRTLGTPRQF